MNVVKELKTRSSKEESSAFILFLIFVVLLFDVPPALLHSESHSSYGFKQRRNIFKEEKKEGSLELGYIHFQTEKSYLLPS